MFLGVVSKPESRFPGLMDILRQVSYGDLAQMLLAMFGIAVRRIRQC